MREFFWRAAANRKLALDKEFSYRFEADVQLQMKAIKGTESEGMPSFFVNGYDMAVTLTEH